ncbi:uncharacterized protein zgc:153044 isoform X1 [Trichomycterus rosablanca]|uniref:uncharacterized protein zgc:153044 isoform X1 n=1 Tax=Trichomycterus rosablanca TaxID=2290929 RepID=UPI002F351DDF
MAPAGALYPCSECNMFSYSFSVFSDNFMCDKCTLVVSLTEKISVLEGRIRALEQTTTSEGLVSAVAVSNASSSGTEPQTPALESSQRGDWVTSRRHSRRAKHQPSQLHVSNRFSPLSDPPAEKPVNVSALVIGDSQLRHVRIATPIETPATIVTCILGARAPDIRANLKVLANANRRFSKIVIHVDTNDVRLRQSEVTKSNVKEVCELARSMSEAVVCSGPLPIRPSGETYSRLLSLNRWMSKWCSENCIDFVDNWSTFEGRPGLLLRDGVHPTWEGSACISCSIGDRLYHRVSVAADSVK